MERGWGVYHGSVPPRASLGQPLRAPPLQAPLLQLRPQHRILALQLLHLREGGRLDNRGRGFGGGGAWSETGPSHQTAPIRQ